MTNNPNVRSGPLAFLATQRIDLLPDANHPAVDTSFLDAAPAPAPTPAAKPQPAQAPAMTPQAPAMTPQAPAMTPQAPAPDRPRPMQPALQTPVPPAAKPQPAKVEMRQPEGKAPGSEPSPKGKFWIIGGVTVFGVVLLGIALSGVLRNINATAPNVTAAGAIPGTAAASTETEPPHGPTVQQQAIMDEISQRLPGQIAQQGAQANADPLFLAALQGAKCKEIVFGDGSIRVTVLLPDPTRLQSLEIGSYTPQTDSQAYIQRSYTALLANAGAMEGRIAYDFDVSFQTQPNGDITYDITMPMLSFPLQDYSEVYTAHMDEYMQNLGFYTAAREVLLPDFQDWESHQGADRNSPALDAYFESLAAALADKGINLNNSPTVDTAQIKAALETRFRGTWLCEGLEFKHAFDGYSLSLRYPNDFMYFSVISDKLAAQYRAGSISAPSSPADLDAMFTKERRSETNVLLAGSPQSRTDMMLQGQFRFDWETLGKRGVAACPDLVEAIRQFINGYDFHEYYFTTETRIFQ